MPSLYFLRYLIRGYEIFKIHVLFGLSHRAQLNQLFVILVFKYCLIVDLRVHAFVAITFIKLFYNFIANDVDDADGKQYASLSDSLLHGK